MSSDGIPENSMARKAGALRQVVLTVLYAWSFVHCPTALAETPAEHLMALVESQDLEKIGEYLAQPGVSIDDRPGDFKSLLDFAAEKNRVTVVKYLLDHGANVNTPFRRTSDKLVNGIGISPLCEAAYFNGLEVMDLLLKHGAEVNTAPQSEAPIICASYPGNLKAAQMLVEYGADVNHIYGAADTALYESIQQRHFDVAEYLVGHGATLTLGILYQAALAGSPDFVDRALAAQPPQNLINEALGAAAGNRHVDETTRERMLSALLAHGADPDAPQNGMPNGMLSQSSSAETAAFLLDHGANGRRKLNGYELAAGFVCSPNPDPLPQLRMLVSRRMTFEDPGAAQWNPIGCAATAGRTDVIDFLVDHGASVMWPDFGGFVPMFYARTRPVVDDLVRHGANVNQTGAQRTPDGTLQPISYLTPLSMAVQSGQWDLVTFLLSVGADVRALWSDFADVAVRGPTDLTVRLLDLGIDVNAVNANAETALMTAARNGATDRVQLLLEHGANPNLRNRGGKTALHLAVEAGNLDMVKLLLSHGAARTIAYDAITPLVEARSPEMRSLLDNRHAASALGELTPQDRKACTYALEPRQISGGNGALPRVREPGEDWDYLEQSGDAQWVLVSGHNYLLTLTADGGYLARVDQDGVERVVCEYGRRSQGESGLRPLTEYERLQARAKRDARSVSYESSRLEGLRGARAILQASRRRHDPVPLALVSDGTLLGDAAEFHRDDLLLFYLEQGVNPNLRSQQRPVAALRTASRIVPALYEAVLGGSDRSVELLLDHGAQPDAADDSVPDPKPVIAVAVMQRSPTIVAELLAHGANPDIPPGPIGPGGSGVYRRFHNALGGEVDQWVKDVLFNSTQHTQDIVANAGVLFQHGASADPWLSTILSQLSIWRDRISLPADIGSGVAASPGSEQVRRVADAIRTAYPPVAALLDVGLRYRDAPSCAPSTPPNELPLCLPGSLRAADADLNTRFALLTARAAGTPESAGLRSSQRDWIRHRDQTCGVKEIQNVTEAGWLSYVLTDSAKAQCVLQFTRERAQLLQTQADAPAA